MTCASTSHTERTVAIALQQWLWERAKMLRYSYIACLSVCVGQLSECEDLVLSKGVLSLVLVCLLHL